MYHIVFWCSLGKLIEMCEIHCGCILFRRDGVMEFPWLLKSQAANPTREHKNHIPNLCLPPCVWDAFLENLWVGSTVNNCTKQCHRMLNVSESLTFNIMNVRRCENDVYSLISYLTMLSLDIHIFWKLSQITGGLLVTLLLIRAQLCK